MNWIMDLFKIGRRKLIRDWADYLNEPEPVIRGVIIQTSIPQSDDLIYNNQLYGRCASGTDNLEISNIKIFKEAINNEGRQYR